MISGRFAPPPREPALAAGERVLARVPAVLELGGPMDVAVGELFVTDRAVRFEGEREGPMSAVVRVPGGEAVSRCVRRGDGVVGVEGGLLVVRGGGEMLRLRGSEADVREVCRVLGGV